MLRSLGNPPHHLVATDRLQTAVTLKKHSCYHGYGVKACQYSFRKKLKISATLSLLTVVYTYYTWKVVSTCPIPRAGCIANIHTRATTNPSLSQLPNQLPAHTNTLTMTRSHNGRNRFSTVTTYLVENSANKKKHSPSGWRFCRSTAPAQLCWHWRTSCKGTQTLGST